MADVRHRLPVKSKPFIASVNDDDCFSARNKTFANDACKKSEVAIRSFVNNALTTVRCSCLLRGPIPEKTVGDIVACSQEKASGFRLYPRMCTLSGKFVTNTAASRQDYLLSLALTQQVFRRLATQ